jgi:hypothetical protein
MVFLAAKKPTENNVIFGSLYVAAKNKLLLAASPKTAEINYGHQKTLFPIVNGHWQRPISTGSF